MGSTKDKSCLACPAKATCDGKAIVNCGDNSKYIKDGECVACKAGAKCDGKAASGLAVGYANFCADENDFQPDTVITRECRGPPQNKGVPKDKCEKAGCKYVESSGDCICTDPGTCATVGGTWFVDTCGKTYGPWMQGWNSCECLAHPAMTVSNIVAYVGAKCCGGKPTMCKGAGTAKKTCHRKYFCKSNQYAEEIKKQPTWPGSTIDVAAKCTECPSGLTCDGSQTVGCNDSTKYFDLKTKQCVACPNGVCPTTAAPALVVQKTEAASSAACLNSLKITVTLAGILGLMY